MRLTFAVAALVFVTGITNADDTDIYLDNTSSTTSAPLVMFSLDYRSNLTSTICSNINACTAATYFRNQGLGADLEGLSKLTFFDVLRLSLKVVLRQPELRGVRVGLMFNHNDESTNCADNNPPGESPTSCSNGGAILMGFRAIQANDANGALQDFDSKLKRLKDLKPQSNSPDHPYQGVELFFEFFHYLTGQGVYNGHSGAIDFEQGSGGGAWLAPEFWPWGAEPLMVASAGTSPFIEDGKYMVAQSSNCPSDSDCDTIKDNKDNCPNNANSDQANLDGDAFGDACDPDDDGDTVNDSTDNCARIPNSTQTDTDRDGTGDACDSDIDGDGIANASDNCPNNANASQTDTDRDGVGDVCDTTPQGPDSDGDGVPDSSDNCSAISNASQSNADNDAFGDACDADDDGDTIEDSSDNCPTDANTSQTNTDGDALGDACDSDDDNDLVLDASDNCRLISNSSQTDLDADGIGDACDSDRDGDGKGNSSDNCPDASNPTQTDLDNDGIGDACDSSPTGGGGSDDDGDGVRDNVDNCRSVANANQLDTDGDRQGDLCDSDDDGDTVADSSDNCPLATNPTQANLDGDSAGDACDTDLDGDSVPNGTDNCPTTPNPTQTDTDGDGLGNACDSTPGGSDEDGDGVFDDRDNCPSTANADQRDLDGDTRGDVCDGDDDGDGVLDGADNCPVTANPTQADADANGFGDACDVGAQTINRSTNMDFYAPASWDSSIEDVDHTRYISPLATTDACAKIYTINFLFGVSQAETESETAIEAAKSSGGIGRQLPSTQNDWFEDMVGFLHSNDLADGSWGTPPNNPNVSGTQNVTSYFFVDPQQKSKLEDHAQLGGTDFPRELGSDPDQLVRDLLKVFREILSVSTTFVAASVPVNVFNRASVVDNVYIALFQANAEGRPYWDGNVKKLKIGRTSGGERALIDANGENAVGTDGRIDLDALTFWTNGSALPPGDNVSTFDGKDGRHVSRGAAGQMIPGFLSPGSPGLTNGASGARTLYYYNGTGLTALNADDTTAAALQTALRASTPTEAKELLRYARGLDPIDTDGDGTPRRSWIMGDPLHSRPLPINYGLCCGHTVAANPAIFIAVGTNDGYLHFIRNTTSGGSESGTEAWAFMPPEGLAEQRTLRANAADLSNPVHPYTVDGAPTPLIIDTGGDGTIGTGDNVFLYFGLRRGGRSYYALDVTNPTSPSFKWRITSDPNGDGTPDGDFKELGLTFSQPKVGKVKIGTSTVNALFFAGGYDPNKDTHALGTNDTRTDAGNALFVVNADTGALIWKAVKGTGSASATKFEHALLEDSIPSNVTIADTDGNNLIDRILVGDTGGRVWRADVGATDSSSWTLQMLANLGRHLTPTRANDRRFFNEPDLVQARDDNGSYDAVVIGSGDRENPLDKVVADGVPENWFYVIKDRRISASGSTGDASFTHTNLADVTNNCLQTGTESSCGITTLNNGWKLQLATNGSTGGEKALAAPLTFLGKIFFTTYIPNRQRDTATCSPKEGNGRLYALSLDKGTAVFNYYDGNTGTLTTSDRSLELRSEGIPAQVVFVPGGGDETVLRPDLTFGEAPGSNRYRTYWQRIEQ